MAHAASQLKKNRDLEINAEEETEKKKKHRKRSRDRKKKVVAMCDTGLSSLCLDFLPASETSMEGFFFFHVQHGVEIGSGDGGLLVKHGHRLGLGQGRLPPESGEGDCGALQKVRLTFQGLPAHLHNTQGCCQGVKVTFFAAGSRLNRLQVTLVCGRAGLCTS